MKGVRKGQYHPVAHVKYKIPETASPAELKLFRDGKYLDCPPDSCHTPGVGGQINVATDPRDVNVKDYTSGNGFGDIYLKKDVKAGEELLVGSYHWPKPVIQARESKAWWNQTPKPVRGILWDLVRHDEDPPGTWRYKWVHPSSIPDQCKRFNGAIANRTPEENLPVVPYKRIATEKEFIENQTQREQRKSRRGSNHHASRRLGKGSPSALLPGRKRQTKRSTRASSKPWRTRSRKRKRSATGAHCGPVREAQTN